MDEEKKYHRLTYGMVGGGQGAFIGEVHRKAINFDDRVVMAAGCFSTSHENTLVTGGNLSLSKDRLYKNYVEMAAKEARRPDTIDFVVIVTPNVTHFAIAKAFLENGIHVVCDKPLTLEVSEGEELKSLAKKQDCLFCVTYTYTGYPAVKQARKMIARGDIGDIRFVNVEYAQEWLATPIECQDHKQAAWRTDPKQSGISNSVGDIGSHVENIVSYTTGLRIRTLCARLDIFGEDRRLDDNASIMVNYTSGATGLYWVSQIAVGCDNSLKLRIFGTRGSIEWEQENPNYLTVSQIGEPKTILSRGRDAFHPTADLFNRLPSGHPEGYFEAFANIYRSFIDSLILLKKGTAVPPADIDYPKIDAGVKGVRFIHRCVESSRQDAAWIDF